jgi:hypothetical protein
LISKKIIITNLDLLCVELEKKLLINELKDKELALQQREIAYLKELNEMMKKQSTQTE